MTIKEALFKINEEIDAREKEITEYDQIVGDGDHALNIQRGFNAIVKGLGDVEDAPQAILTYVGKTLMNVVGGTSGAIYGMAFMAGAIACKGKEWNFDTLIDMIRTAAQRITKAGDAQIGEKTLYDVWGAIDRDYASIKDAETLRTKTVEYMEGTKEMSATKGRASYIGDRSIGIMDPGAVSSEIIIRFLSQTV